MVFDNHDSSDKSTDLTSRSILLPIKETRFQETSSDHELSSARRSTVISQQADYTLSKSLSRYETSSSSLLNPIQGTVSYRHGPLSMIVIVHINRKHRLRRKYPNNNELAANRLTSKSHALISMKGILNVALCPFRSINNLFP
jgi:hypothetical protein